MNFSKVSKRLCAILLLTMIFSVPLLVFGPNLGQVGNRLSLSIKAVQNGEFVKSVEHFVAQEMPMRVQLQQLAISLRYWSGDREQNDIFITPEMLLKNTPSPQEDLVLQNKQGIETFVQNMRKPTYFMLVPTAIAIKQQLVPEAAATNLFNQKTFIQEEYAGYSGTVSVVDIYPALFANQDRYLYYKTHENLTGLGGYTIYEVLGRRLGLSPLKGLDQYNIEYWSSDFYGSVYESSPYKSIDPDVISLYRFAKYKREYQVTHYSAQGEKVYYTLYPKSAPAIGEPMDVLFGGRSPVIDVSVFGSGAGKDTLLLFGDETTVSYLPFLLPHYQRVTWVNLALITEQELLTLSPQNYGQVLIACTTESYGQNADLAKLAAFPPRT